MISEEGENKAELKAATVIQFHPKQFKSVVLLDNTSLDGAFQHNIIRKDKEYKKGIEAHNFIIFSRNPDTVNTDIKNCLKFTCSYLHPGMVNL